ncbi:hypothetical protein HF086_002532 [Spodoptera exigua]|uniref:Uncharacterized protein n=1 Tax=Spodoptera exigua TaxID=7107 RepID=A0A922S946_SPOEX|nr:hypothetical protein HF086_002532 [Spodoptera exigua]
MKGLRFPNHAAWDTYGGRVPDLDEEAEDNNTREEDGKITFTASSVGGEQLSEALAALRIAAGAATSNKDSAPEPEDESDDEPTQPPPPIVISEADFREKGGYFYPCSPIWWLQEADVSEDSKSEDKKEARKPRVNIAMAAIMRKQEETNKQVKFVTPPPTPDSIPDTTESKDDRPKVIQPKAIKSLANLPLGRKTGGILSLKDKSAGYPHLVLNTEPEPPKKTEKEDKKDIKPSPSSQTSQNYVQKRQEHAPSPNWNPQNSYPDAPRMNFQKNYGIQNSGLSYNPSYPAPSVNNQGIRLPVVNPKEIDVRTAALQKQNSRAELFQDGQKLNHNYQMSGDKKNFLNDLPPRFANQYRYWHNAQENQFNDNKFRDDNFKQNSLFNGQLPRSWGSQPPQPPQPPQADGYQPPMWWKPDQTNNFNANFQQQIQPNFYSPQHLNTNLPNPYQNLSYNQLPNNMAQSKQEGFSQPGYMQSAIGQPQLQTLQTLVTSPNFNSSLNSFSYAPTVGYDSSLYPQFSNKLGYQPLQMKVEKPLGYQGNKELMDMNTLGFGGTALDMQQRNINFNDPLNNDIGNVKNMDQIGSGEGASGAAPGSTYSLFSGAPDTSAWGSPAHAQPPSLWSGPGPSPLERLLEQQKQLKAPQ